MVLFPEEFKVSRSLRKTLRNGPYTTRLDSDFERDHPRLRGAAPLGPRHLAATTT